MTRRVLLAMVLVAACDSHPQPPPRQAGIALERAAVVRGLASDPSTVAPVGAYATETDRVCIVPVGDAYRLGASVDYGSGQTCLARGTARGAGRLEVRLGPDCRFTAALENDRVTFPALLPPACDRACGGRASFAALAADRLSASAAEARSIPAPDGAALCG